MDFNDQHRKYEFVGRKSCKWWRYPLWLLIDESIVNAYILEKEALNHLSHSQLLFSRLEQPKMLICDFSSHSLTVCHGRNTDGHWPRARSKGCCKRRLKRKVVKFNRLVLMSCDIQVCLECFPNHTEGDL